MQCARTNTEAFARGDVDAIITTAAGCGHVMKDYGHLLADHGAISNNADKIARRVFDICEYLVREGFARPRPLTAVGTAAYHDACHLLHGAHVIDEPREILEAALGRPVADLGDNHLCCGSAGSYNVTHHQIAKAIGTEKAKLMASSNPALVAVGNIGCILQLERAAELRGLKTRVVHPVELLAEAYHAANTGT